MNKQMTFRLVCLGLVLFALAGCAPGGKATVPPAIANDKLDEIMARGTLVIATDFNYPPFSRRIEGAARMVGSKCSASQATASEIEGFDAMTGAEIAHRLGVEPCFVSPQWSQLVAGNWANAWDISVGSMTPTYERMEVLYFTQPYFATPIHVFIHADNVIYQKPEDLSGKRIGTCAGCTYERYLNGTLDIPGVNIVFRIQDSQLIAYDNELPAFEALARGDGVELDAIVTQVSAGQDAINSGKPLRKLDPPLYFAYAAASIDKKSSRDPVSFVKKVTEIIQDMHQDGTLAGLSLEWLGIDLASEAANFDVSAFNQFP